MIFFDVAASNYWCPFTRAIVSSNFVDGDSSTRSSHNRCVDAYGKPVGFIVDSGNCCLGSSCACWEIDPNNHARGRCGLIRNPSK